MTLKDDCDFEDISKWVVRGDYQDDWTCTYKTCKVWGAWPLCRKGDSRNPRQAVCDEHALLLGYRAQAFLIRDLKLLINEERRC